MLAVNPVIGRFPWAVSTSVYLAPRVHNIGVLVGYRNWGENSSADYKQGSDRNLRLREPLGLNSA
jgi:hypothetical protein